jgi:hypothetical protein
MRYVTSLAVHFLVLIMSGCATLPTGPGVRVFPTSGKPYDLFLDEDIYCRQAAERQIGMTPQEVTDRNTATGALVGTAVGTGLGAAIGAASGNAGVGAVIGGASGLLIGSASGADVGRFEGREAQRRYDTAYLQCMYSHGNQVYPPAQSYYQRRTYMTAPYPADYRRTPPDYVPLYPPPGTPPPGLPPVPPR